MEVWIMIIAMFALMYFLMIRPENKRKKEAQNMRDSLAVGGRDHHHRRHHRHHLRGEGEHHRH